MQPNPTIYANNEVIFWEQNGQYADLGGDTYYRCRDSVTTNDKMLIAYTLKSDSPREPQMIRICPLFLSYIARQRYWDIDQLDSS